MLWASAAISLRVITHTAVCRIHHHQQKCFKENVHRAHFCTTSAWQHIFWFSLHHCWVLLSHGSSLLLSEGLCQCRCRREHWSESKHRLWENTNRVLLHLDSSWRQIKVFWWEHNPIFPIQRGQNCAARDFYFFTIMHKNEVITPRGGGLTLNPPQIQWAYCDK